MIAPTSVLQDPVGKTFSVLTTVCLQCILPPGMGCVLVALRRPWVWLFLPLKGRKDHNTQKMCVDLLLFSFGLFVSVCVMCVCTCAWCLWVCKCGAHMPRCMRGASPCLLSNLLLRTPDKLPTPHWLPRGSPIPTSHLVGAPGWHMSNGTRFT